MPPTPILLFIAIKITKFSCEVNGIFLLVSFLAKTVEWFLTRKQSRVMVTWFHMVLSFQQLPPPPLLPPCADTKSLKRMNNLFNNVERNVKWNIEPFSLIVSSWYNQCFLVVRYY